MNTYPLAQTQLGMFLEWNVDLSTTRYNISLVHRLPKTVDADRLAAAVDAFVAAHPVCRTRFVEVDGEVRQYSDPDLDIAVARSSMSDDEAEEYAKRYMKPFDPFVGPLCRFEIVEAPSRTYLCIDCFHVLSDGSAMCAFNDFVGAVYDGREPEREQVAFADYAAAEAASFETPEYKAAAEYHKARFAGRTMTVPEGAPEMSAAFFAESATLPRETIDAWCRANGVHPHFFFMGAFARTLALFANEKDAMFFTVNHGRRDARLRRTAGALVKTLPVLAEMDGSMTLASFISGLKLHNVGVYPFTHFCRDLGIKPGWGYVFQEETQYVKLRLGSAVSEGEELMVGGAGEMPAMQVFGTGDSYTLRMTCEPGRYSRGFLRDFANRCATIALNFAAAPADATLRSIPTVSPSEEADVLRVSKGDDLEYDASLTFVDHFRRQVAAHPGKRAVTDCETSLTYAELDAQSDALAAELRRLGVKPGGFVGVMLPRRVSFMVAAIAAQKCGCGYVPCDADYPADRLAYMLENSEAPVLVTTKTLFEGRGIEYSGKLVFTEDAIASAAAPFASLATPDTPAYMIYTSGSTGKPKGVVLPNRALAAMMAWFIRDCALSEKSVNASITSFSFDASVPDLFPPLAAGGELHILSEELRKDLAGVRDYVVANGVTGMTTSTQLGLALVNTYPDLPLEYMMLGGEKMVPFAKTAVRMLNGYGPTEFAVCSSYHEVDQSKSYDIPIGRAVPNTWSVVVDKLGALVPPGMPGELALVGPQIADGYWRLPEKTAAVFVDCPFPLSIASDSNRLQSVAIDHDRPQPKMYRTGDLARYNPAGELDFLGRIDFQVKLRGFRIEIGEIEHAAASFPGVGAVAAEVREIAGAKHLVLYFEGGVDKDALKAKMASTLTSYMVPDFFVAMDRLPLTPNGKIDRRKLPSPELSDEPTVPPANDAEKRVFDMVSAVLGTTSFGVTHDFNRLGLTSLGAMSLLAKLKKECGMKVSMRELTDNPSVRQLSALAKPGESSSPSRPSRPRRSSYPLTENQRGVYADWMRAPDALQYNIPAAFKFTGMDPSKLVSAAEKVFAAHPAFMTRFGEKDGEIVQFRHDDARIAVPVERLDFEPDAAFFSSRMKPFALSGEDLARATVFVSPSASYLFIDIHHAIFDGFSLGIFLTELMRTLDGAAPVGESYTAFDAAIDERDYMESELLADDDAWFDRYIGGVESTKPENSVSGADGRPGEIGRARELVDAAAVSAKCSALGVTASDYFLAVFTEFLKRTGRQDEVCINFVTAGRTNPETADAIGMFVRTLPIRGAKDAKTFEEAARKIRGDVRELLGRERASFVRLSERLSVRPNVIFAFEGGIFDLPAGIELIEPENNVAKAPLSVVVTPRKDAFDLLLEYDSSIYSSQDMASLAQMFATLSMQIAGAPANAPLASLPVVPSEEAARLLALSFGGDIDCDHSETFVDLFLRQVAAHPDSRAVVDCGTALTYAELDARSDALAAELRALGVKPGGFVGVMLPRRVSFMVAAIAVQKCGCGYVPCDADYPADRLAYMLENSEAPVLVTVKALFDGKGIDYKGRVVYADDVPARDGATAPFSSLAAPDTPAYMIYTSGSTGKPKGVVIPNRALRHMVAWAAKAFELVPGSRVATHPSFSFDASVIDLFPVLAAGGELHIFVEELRKDLPGMRDYIVKNNIEGCTMSTQIGMTLLDTYPDLPLGYMMVGGEKLMPISKTDVEIFNGYGPTEFTVCSSYQVVDQAREGDIPIGRAVPGTYSLIVDRYGHLLPQGFPGELALLGPQIADGYWKLPEKTASVFVGCPFSLSIAAGGNRPQSVAIDRNRPQTKMYRTGDLARYNAEGTMDYLGRIDFQVKLRGFRIEIGEIEHCAKSFPGVKEVAAEVRDVGGTKHLVLYYGSTAQLDEAALRAKMAGSLTDYMVPDYFVRMDPMPLTPNGKINRRMLPTPAGNAAEAEYVAPANETEQAVADVYATVLKLEKFGVTTDFFASGGTSLIGIKAVVALQKKGLDVQYGDIFKHKTPRSLAAFLRGEPEPSASVSAGAASGAPAPFDYGAFDYTAIEMLLGGTRTELFDGFRRHSLGDVLLTGATGYLGIHVLRHLLETTDATVYALVRPKLGVSAERRLDSQYVYYFGTRVPKAYRDRLAFVEGDITDSDLVAKLAGLVIGTVFNCAAMVKHYVADDAMDEVNVGGVENLLAWCEKSGARFVHTSTYSVGGFIRSDSATALTERALYVGQSSDNDYVRTKFLAERAVLSAVAAGKVRGKIMRLGNLMGRESDGEFQINVGSNAFVNSLKSYKALGAYPLEELAKKIEMSPIDRVAEAVCLLATTPDDMYVFHPYNCYALDMGAVIGAMNRRGYEIDCVSRKDFATAVDALRNDPAKAAELQGILHYAVHLAKDQRMTPTPNDWTTTVLYRLGFRWRPAEDNYLARFLEMLDGLAVFD